MDEVCAMAPGTSVMTKGYLSAEESGLRTRVRFVKAGKYLDERRFARPILAQEAVDLILIDGDRYVVKGNLAGEGLAPKNPRKPSIQLRKTAATGTPLLFVFSSRVLILKAQPA